MLIETEINSNSELPWLNDLACRSAFVVSPVSPCDIFASKPECKIDAPLCKVEMTLASANVLSLKEKDAGFFGKAGLLAEQFFQAGFDLVGLQETRARSSTVISTNGFLRFIEITHSLSKTLQ